MPLIDALERCPRAKLQRTDMPRYREADKHLRAILGRVAARLEPAGPGGAYLEPAGEAPLEAVAAELRAAVRRELRLPLRTGAGPVKFVARLAAEEAGPDGFRAVAPAEVQAFLAPLPVGRLPGVGQNTEARLEELGVRTAGELAALGRAAVERALGNHGLAVLAAALGQGDDRIRATGHPQSLSQETTLAADTLDRAVLAEHLRGLAERLERALSLEGLEARRVLLKVRYGDEAKPISRSQAVDPPIASGEALLARALDLLGRTQAGIRPVRLLGLAVAGLTRPRRDERQLPLFEG